MKTFKIFSISSDKRPSLIEKDMALYNVWTPICRRKLNEPDFSIIFRVLEGFEIFRTNDVPLVSYRSNITECAWNFLRGTMYRSSVGWPEKFFSTIENEYSYGSGLGAHFISENFEFSISCSHLNNCKFLWIRG